MVVLESHSHSSHHTHSHSMASTGGGGGGGINEYNIPLYPGNLSPTMLDSKKSPLAMLVATCSQIGADPCHPASNTSSNSKFSKKIQPPSPNEPNNNHHHQASHKQNHRSSRSPPNNQKSSSTSPTLSMTNLTTTKSPSPTQLQSLTKPKSESQPPSDQGTTTNTHKKSQKRPRSSSSMNSNTNSSASTISPIPPPPKSARSSSQTPPTPATSSSSTTAPTTSAPSSDHLRDNSNCIASPTPTIRSGMEVLHGGHRYPSGGPMGSHGHGGHMNQMAAAAAAGYYYPGMMDPSTAMFLLQNPAFRDLRLPFPVSGPGSPYGAAAAAAAAAASSPYLSPYYRPPPSGKSECKDPYCTGCPPPTTTPQGICPAGCASCDHQKVPYPSFYHPSAQPLTPSQAQQATHSPTGSGAQQPHICNWIVGDNYCGKRFTSSEELLTHLRSHTSAAQATAAAENSASALALQQHLAASSLYSGGGGHHPAFLQQMGLGGSGGGGQQGQLAAMAMQQMQAQMRGFSQFGINPYPPQGPGQGSKHQGFGLPPGYYPPPNPYAGLFPSRPV